MQRFTYVLNDEGKAMMPTRRFGKVRYLLNNKLAKVVKRIPFTIQLLYPTTHYTQDLNLGIDSGYLHIGYSVTSEKNEVFSGEVTMLQGMKERLKERQQYRRTRRNRLRYRKPGFNDNKPEGWLAPSLQHKLDAHIRFIELIHKILPITEVIVEVANFDIQKIKNPDIQGIEYQQGEQYGFWNLREYILHRDNHQCQNPNCKNKSEHPILELHHIIFRSNGGTDSPNNLITLCNQCHTPENHRGFLIDWKPKIQAFKDATFMSTIRWKLVNILKDKFQKVQHTYGFITKSRRIEFEIEKSHYNDAFIISGGHAQLRCQPIMVEQKRRNNRSLCKFYDAKFIDIRTGLKTTAKDLNCGRTNRNKNLNGENLRLYRGEKVSKGRNSHRVERATYQPGDLVEYKHQFYLVAGSQNKGKYVKLKNLKKVPKVQENHIIKLGKGFNFIDSKIVSSI